MAEVTQKQYVANINDLVISEENPRDITRKELDKLKKSLQEFPEMKEMRPIVIDEDNKILAGHQRVFALKELDYENVSVLKVVGLTKKQKREFMVKDNVSSGKWDTDIIANHWNLDELESFGVPAFKLPNDANSDDGNSYKSHEVTCPHCGEHFELSEAKE